MWFEYYHWIMFTRLISLPLVSSPILIYQGFSRLWAISNSSSIGLLSFYVFVLTLLHYKMDSVQRLLTFFEMIPGVIKISLPTLRLYSVLSAKKDERARELLICAHTPHHTLPLPEQTLAHASVNSIIFSEYTVGSMQAAISLIVSIPRQSRGL